MSQGPRWLAERLGLFLCAGAIDDQLLATIDGGWEHWPSKDSTVYSGQDSELTTNRRYRASRRLYPPVDVQEQLSSTIGQLLPSIASHFEVALTSLEETQVLRYSVGDHFAKHRDGRTGGQESVPGRRRISLVCLLSAPQDYAGGDFVIFPTAIDGHGRGLGLRLDAGELLAFPADLEHQVTAVEQGTRLSVVTWAS